MRAYRIRTWATAASLSLATMIGAAACGDDGSVTPPDAPGPTPDGQESDGPVAGQTIRLSEDITANTTLKAENTYIIPRLKPLFVTNGATLTIEPGTVIKGEQGSVLVIARGSKIMAEGTKEKPIVLTSSQADGQKVKGFWGGLLVLGKAPINNNHVMAPGAAQSDDTTFEAFTSAIPDGKFGGTDPHDNSGVLKYVRVEFAGFNFVSNREFNNVTLCGVGDATVVDYLQVHGGSDDGIELFGGTVNVKHIVSSQNQDDGFDTDNGWVGKGQFIVVQDVDPQASAEASNGYESDNHADDPMVDNAFEFGALPRTLPTVSNVTVIGKRDYHAPDGMGHYDHFAAVIRRGTAGHYSNHIWVGFTEGFSFRDTATDEQITAGNLFIKNTYIFNVGPVDADHPNGNPFAPGGLNEEPYLTNGATVNGTLQPWNNHFADPKLVAEATSPTAPSFALQADSPALTGAEQPAGDAFFEAVTFVGAVGTEDWTAGWTAYPQPAAP